MFKSLMQKRIKGVGGMFFVVISVICSLIMLVTITFGRMTTIISISNNISHLVSTKIAVYCWNNKIDSFEQNGTNYTISANDTSYNPLNDFNDIMEDYGFIVDQADTAYMKWDKANSVATFQPSSFKIDTGNTLTLEEQSSKIEDK